MYTPKINQLNHVIAFGKVYIHVNYSRDLSKAYAMTKMKYDMETNSVSVREKKKSVKESPRQKCCVSERDRVSSQPTPYHEAKPSNAPLISHWIYDGENENKC